jgi:hypothetical protein
MPLTNERFDEYLENNVKRANLMSLSKEFERNQMFSSMNRRAWLWINQRSSISLIKPSLDDDSDDDICQLKCKHCSLPKRFDNADMAAIVNDKRKMSRIFIADESDSESESENRSKNENGDHDGQRKSFLLRAASKATTQI